MGTPAVNEDQYLWRSLEQYVRPVGSPTWGQPSNITALAGRFVKARPASSSSPRREDGTRAPLPWKHTGTSFRQWSGEHGFNHSGALEFFYTNGFEGRFGPGTPWGHLMVDAQTRAFQQWHEKAKNSKVNLGLALAEAHKTVNLVGSTATSIANRVRNFRLRHPRHVWRYFKENGRFRDQRVTDEYLKMCYGWTPLLGEVDGSLQYLADLVTGGRPLTFRVVGQAKSVDRVEVSNAVLGHLTQDWTVHDSAMCKVSCLLGMPSHVLRDLSSLGLTNPASIVWEMVPWSFVVDWFLPIGSWLDSLDSMVGITFHEGSMSLVSRRKATGPVRAQSHASYVYEPWVRQLSPSKYSFFDFQRMVLLQPPERILPSLRAPLSLDKLAKGLSLLVGAFR